MSYNIVIDELNINGFKIKQDKNLFSFGTDAVLLSYFAKIRKNEKVLDIGTGNGIVPVLLFAARNTLDFHVTGAEIQKESFEIAKENILLNGLCGKFDVLNIDINNAPEHLEYNSFNVVVTNPPYMKKDTGFVSGSDFIKTAKHEVKLTLEELLYQASRLLKSNGRFYMIHRAERLYEVLDGMKRCGIEPKEMQFVYGRADLKPDLFLVEGRKAQRPGLVILEPLILRNSENEFTDEVKLIYQGRIRK